MPSYVNRLKRRKNAKLAAGIASLILASTVMGGVIFGGLPGKESIKKIFNTASTKVENVVENVTGNKINIAAPQAQRKAPAAKPVEAPKPVIVHLNDTQKEQAREAYYVDMHRIALGDPKSLTPIENEVQVKARDWMISLDRLQAAENDTSKAEIRQEIRVIEAQIASTKYKDPATGKNIVFGTAQERFVKTQGLEGITITDNKDVAGIVASQQAKDDALIDVVEQARSFAEVDGGNAAARAVLKNADDMKKLQREKDEYKGKDLEVDSPWTFIKDMESLTDVNERIATERQELEKSAKDFKASLNPKL